MAKRNKYVTYKKKKSKRKKYFTQNKFKIKRRKTHKNKKLRTKKNRSIKKGGRLEDKFINNLRSLGNSLGNSFEKSKAKQEFNYYMEKNKIKKEVIKLTRSIELAIRFELRDLDTYKNDYEKVLKKLNDEYSKNQKKELTFGKIIPELINHKSSNYELLNNHKKEKLKDTIIKSFKALYKFGIEQNPYFKNEIFYDDKTKNEIKRISSSSNKIIKIHINSMQHEMHIIKDENFDENIESINNLITNVKEQLQIHRTQVKNNIINIESKIKSVKELGKNFLEKVYIGKEDVNNKFEEEEKITWSTYKQNKTNPKISEVEFYEKKIQKLNDIKKKIDTYKKNGIDFNSNLSKYKI